jgi:plasmid stabilization system protein ParE
MRRGGPSTPSWPVSDPLADHAERGHAGPRSDSRQISVTFGNSGYVIQYRVSVRVVVIARIKHALERP